MLDGDDGVVGQGQLVDDREQVVVAGEVVRRIRVDHRCRMPDAGCQDVSEDRMYRGVPLLRELRDRRDVLFRRIDRRRVGGAAGDGLEREDAATREEVEEVGAGNPGADDVEERLPRAF